MKIIGMVCVLNEAEFLDDFFEYNLPLVDLIVVAEGGVHGYPFKCSVTGRSLDKTNYYLDMWKAMYPDKIKIIRKDNPWNSKQAQQNSMLKYANDGNWCFIFGTDEFYAPDTREKLERIIKKYPNITEITWPTVHFFNDDKHMIVNSEFNNVKMIRREQRFFKYKTGMFYVNHPTINDIQNRDIFFNPDYVDKKLNLGMDKKFERYKYRSDLMGLWDYNEDNIIYRYHYGFIRDMFSRVKKHIYYLMRDRGYSLRDAVNFLVNKTDNDLKVMYGYINQIHQTKDITVGECKYNHPLKDKKWKNSVINLEEIKTKYYNFDENPEK